MTKNIQTIALAGILLGLLPVAAAASDPSGTLTGDTAGAAQALVAARQANARAQHEGRPSVWMIKPSPTRRHSADTATATQ